MIGAKYYTNLQICNVQRFPIGRPFVNANVPYGQEFFPDQHLLGGPTFGSLWTRRQVCNHSVIFSIMFS